MEGAIAIILFVVAIIFLAKSMDGSHWWYVAHWPLVIIGALLLSDIVCK